MRHLSMDEVKTVIRLVGEIRELGEDPLAWRQHLLGELSRIMGVKAGFVGEAFIAALPRHIHMCGMAGLCHGDARAWAVAQEYLAHADRSHDPLQPTVARTRGRSFTTLRPPVVDDRVWYRSAVYEGLSRPLGVDSVIYSHVPLPDRDWVHTVVLHRDDKDEPFTERHATMVQLVQEELARLWEEESARRAQKRPKLPPRLLQTLECLASGCAEKEAANRLGLSRHTVHDYIKQLHRRFGAANRGELLARSADVRRPFHPRLAYETDAQVQPARPVQKVLARIA